MIKPLAAYDWVLWDWNGTLIDDTSLTFGIFSELVLRYTGRPLTLTNYRREMRLPIRDYYLDLGFDLERFSFEDITGEFHRRYDEQYHGCPLHEGVLEIFGLIRSSNVRQGILSALPNSILVASVERFGINDFLDDLTSPDNVLAKGKIEEGHAWSRKRAVDPKRVVLVGDTEHDAEAAAALGFDCILISRGYHDEVVLGRTGHPVLGSIRELHDQWGAIGG